MDLPRTLLTSSGYAREKVAGVMISDNGDEGKCACGGLRYVMESGDILAIGDDVEILEGPATWMVGILEFVTDCGNEYAFNVNRSVTSLLAYGVVGLLGNGVGSAGTSVSKVLNPVADCKVDARVTVSMRSVEGPRRSAPGLYIVAISKMCSISSEFKESPRECLLPVEGVRAGTDRGSGVSPKGVGVWVGTGMEEIGCSMVRSGEGDCLARN